MTDSDNMLKNRFAELSSRCVQESIYTETDFLTPAEMNLLKSTVGHVPYRFFGGYELCEKAVCVFGDIEICGYEYEPSFTYLKIEPSNPRFSDELKHRDFLGSIMSLGINRNTFGDLIVKSNCGYVITTEHIGKYICDNLNSVKHTSVSCGFMDSLPEDVLPVLTESSFVVTSERLDSILSSLYKLSRSESKAQIEHEQVLVDGKTVTKPDYIPKTSEIITLHGHGKFIYVGIETETKKGRLRCTARIFS